MLEHGYAGRSAPLMYPRADLQSDCTMAIANAITGVPVHEETVQSTALAVHAWGLGTAWRWKATVPHLWLRLCVLR